MQFKKPREVKTTLSCPNCGDKLNISRSCHEVRMHCPACGQKYPLADFIMQADKAMEEFMEDLFVDRI